MSSKDELLWRDAMRLAIQEAKKYEGATAPNPPVGAVLLDRQNQILTTGVHTRAGEPHAEVVALSKLQPNQIPHTLVVSLEPCNHLGRTPPCTQKIVMAGIRRVIFGVRDPNPKVVGGGLEYLRKAGIEVHENFLHEEASELIQAFLVHSKLGRPFVVVKTVWNEEKSMIPPPGQKTFSSEESLVLAHQWRKSSDAIVTGIGTVLADRPLFTVRRVEDHPGKHRDLYVLDRQGRMPLDWKERQTQLGFRVYVCKSLEEVFEDAVRKEHLQILVEAGPQLSETFLNSQYWDLHLKIEKGNPDRVEKIFRSEISRILGRNA